MVFIGICAVLSNTYPTGTLRYKMTVVIETPEGLKSGSAVREISMDSAGIINVTGGAGTSRLEKGEAVVIDLGNRGVAFALMLGKYDSEYPSYMILHAFPRKDKRFTSENIRYYRSLKKAHAVLTPDLYPVFVRFKDLNDPKTIEDVSVVAEKKQSRALTVKTASLADIYGDGVSLSSISVEITQDHIQDEIVNWLPWLHEGQRYISGDIFSGLSLYEQLKTNNFKRGW